MRVKADLHIHTVLSPCGDLDMSPGNILRAALERGLGLIGITDHNSTRQALLIQEWGREMGVAVLAGAEVTTAEEAHCLAFFPTPERLAEFQRFLDRHLPPVPNNPDKFGYQVAVNRDDEILYEEPLLLLSALTAEDLWAGIDYSGYLPRYETHGADFREEYNQRLLYLGRYGYGIFSTAAMFRIDGTEIVPVESADEITLDRFVGYEILYGESLCQRAFPPGPAAHRAAQGPAVPAAHGPGPHSRQSLEIYSVYRRPFF